MLKQPDRSFIERLIINVATEEILPRFCTTGYEIKHDGSLLTEADLAADKKIHQTLKKYWPDIAFLSEEMPLAEQEEKMATSELLWCLDPVDGTSNFAAGIPLFATSLALLDKGEVIMAFTYDPIRKEMFSAEKGKGAWLNNNKLHCHSSHFKIENAIAIVDLKRLSPSLAQRILLNPPYKSQRNLGSCVLEWAWMAANRGHIYLHGGMKLWDLAAGSLLLSEAGGYSSTLEGDVIFNASMQPRSVIISPDKNLFKQWYDYLTQ